MTPTWSQHLIVLAIVAVIAAGLASCYYVVRELPRKAALPAVSPPGQPTSTPINEPEADQPYVAPLTLSQWVQTRSVLVVDARLGTLYRRGHIPSALNIPALRPDESTLDHLASTARDTTIVVYCESASCTDSQQVAQMLAQRGVLRVRTLRGGWQAWRDLGLPTEVSNAN